MELPLSSTCIPSQIFIQSAIKYKQLTITKQTSKRQEYTSCFSDQNQEDCWNPKLQRIRVMEQRIANISINQQQLIGKFQKTIDNLTRQILKKDQINDQIQREIEQLKKVLEDGRNDMKIIQRYLKKEETKQNNQKRKYVLDTTKASNQLDKSNSGLKKQLDLTYKPLKMQRRTITTSPIQFQKKAY